MSQSQDCTSKIPTTNCSTALRGTQQQQRTDCTSKIPATNRSTAPRGTDCTSKIPAAMSQSQDCTSKIPATNRSTAPRGTDCTSKIPATNRSTAPRGTDCTSKIPATNRSTAPRGTDCTSKIPATNRSTAPRGTDCTSKIPATMSQSQDCTSKIPAAMSQSQDCTSKTPATNRSTAPPTSRHETALVKYGELIPLGSNGEEDRTKSQFTLSKRPKANGLKPSAITTFGVNESVSMGDQHRITFTTAVATVVLEYCEDRDTDLYQIGRLMRDTESQIDFGVTDAVARSDGRSLISRYACRIICQRNPPYTAHIYAAGFDSSNNIFLGLEAVKWDTDDGQMDGLITNGVRVKHPSGPWTEISVLGHAFAPRKPGCKDRGIMVDGHDAQELMDGSLIDLGGVTLLWRTA